MYRPPNRPPKGAWATHLHAIRRERDLSQVQAFELVQEGLGLSPKSRAVYIAIDMGDRQPKPEEAEYLASVFGWPSAATEPTESGDPLVAALTRQSEAIEALVALLTPLVSDQASRLSEAESLLARLSAQAFAGAPTPRAPRAAGG